MLLKAFRCWLLGCKREQGFLSEPNMRRLDANGEVLLAVCDRCKRGKIYHVELVQVPPTATSHVLLSSSSGVSVGSYTCTSYTYVRKETPCG